MLQQRQCDELTASQEQRDEVTEWRRQSAEKNSEGRHFVTGLPKSTSGPIGTMPVGLMFLWL